ncbi:unnamed protein product, partial [Anisakis simplex]|uniref:G_PROTEIN_RECEP_F1_2 domain-containing protein n=1 Tax=Anisakis simplex TaxID=6269 RepID=A0A0M3KEG6_ANISI
MIAENQQLTIEDIGAGLFLIFYGLIGIIVYLIVCLAMCQMCAEIVGFRFLISQAITDMLLMIQFGIWPGIVILSKDEYLPENYRWHLHIYLDFMWWAMVYHYPMVAWSRLAAIEWPNWFRCLSHATCTAICCIPWCIALMQSVIEHQFDWFKPLYYDSDLYGLTTDWQEYNASGTGRLYSFCNVLSMILPFPFYTIAFCSIIRRNKRHSKSSVTSEKLSVTKNKYRRKDSLSAINVLIQKQLTIETRLIIPCLINTIFFVFGQV